jgi:hypothetical protein
MGAAACAASFFQAGNFVPKLRVVSVKEAVMKRTRLLFSLLLICFVNAAQAQTSAAKPWSDPSPHKVGFVTVNRVRLNYLDWGGSGPALILIHGMGANPHWFDDLAPAFTDRFHVIAYARRGHGESESKSPYDTATLTEDLRGLMDALGIAKANLVLGKNSIEPGHPLTIDAFSGKPLPTSPLKVRLTLVYGLEKEVADEWAAGYTASRSAACILQAAPDGVPPKPDTALIGCPPFRARNQSA